MKLLAIIKSYQTFKTANPDTWKNYAGAQKNLLLAIKIATSCKDKNGRKHPHQYRIQSQSLLDFEVALLAHTKAIQSIADFDTLYSFIYSKRTHGIGELCAYDVAIRIGAFLNLEPTKIYLHAGTRKGVEILLGKSIITSSINKSDLPEPLSSSALTCYELEDLLCIYKERFIK